MKLGTWNAAHTAQLVDAHPVATREGSQTMRVTVRTNGELQTHGEALAMAAAPTEAIGAVATLYTQFASQGFTYYTYVVSWPKR